MMNEDIRALFPITKDYVYLNHAAIAPYSIPVSSVLHTLVNDITNHGSVNWHNWLEVLNSTRKIAAELVGAKIGTIAFVRNTSDGLSVVANGIDWQQGDNVVSCDIEFPANIYPWMNLQKRGVELRLARAEGGRIEPEAVFELVDESTKVISLSWVQYSSGFRADLRSIGRFCRERDLLFVVDAIQGLGALKLDVEADYVDAFAADAHKFLMGPEGVGLLYMSERAMARVTPSIVGWLSVKDWWNCFNEEYDYKIEFPPNALRFECGTPNTLGIHGTYAAIDLIMKIGSQEIENYLIDFGYTLRKELEEIGFETFVPKSRQEASAIVCCRHPNSKPEELYRKLSEKKIITAARCGWLRVSPHFYNNTSDIDKLINTLAKLTSR